MSEAVPPGHSVPDQPVRGRASIIQNVGFLSAAQAAAMLLNVVALVHIARMVGNHWFGVVQLGVVFSSYVLIVAEWGMYTLGIREVARLDAPAAIRRYASTHVGLLMSMAVAAMIAAAAVLPLFAFYRHDPVVFLLYLGAAVPMALSLDWLGMGLERMAWVSAARTLRSLLYAGGVLLLLRSLDGVGGWPAPRWVPSLFLVAYLVATSVMWFVTARWLGGWIKVQFGPGGEWRRRLGAAGPIGAANLTMRVLLNVDVLLLGVLVNPASVGDYAAAAKVVFVLVIAVEVLWRAILPRLARLWHADPRRFRQRFNLYLGLSLAGLVPLAVAGALLGQRLMDRLYGDDYTGAGAVARILSVSYVLLAVGQFFGNALLASDRQRAYFPPLAFSAVVAVVAVASFASLGGGTGAALGMLLAHLVFLFATGWICRDLIGRRLRRPLLAAGLGAAAMAAVLASLPPWPLVTLVPLGAAVYALVAGPLLVPWLVHERRR